MWHEDDPIDATWYEDRPRKVVWCPVHQREKRQCGCDKDRDGFVVKAVCGVMIISGVVTILIGLIIT